MPRPALEQVLAASLPADPVCGGRPAPPIRLMAGLLYLKHTYDLSDEQVCERWLEKARTEHFGSRIASMGDAAAFPPTSTTSLPHTVHQVVICDSNPDGTLAAAVERKRADARLPIRYQRNPSRLGEPGGTIRGTGLAQGEYVKSLHDDVLEPECQRVNHAIGRQRPRLGTACSAKPNEVRPGHGPARMLRPVADRRRHPRLRMMPKPLTMQWMYFPTPNTVNPA